MPLAGLNLLIVEDEAVTRSLLGQVMESRGHSVRSAADGFEALRLIRQGVPEMVLSDLNMPGMSGFELLYVVRRLYPEIYVIATSGAYSGTEVPRGIAADAFHEKASGLKRLFEAITDGAGPRREVNEARRGVTPLWVDMQPGFSKDKQHVLISCPLCLRPFRMAILAIDGSIRETECVYCGGVVSYAIALGVNPLEAPKVVPIRVFEKDLIVRQQQLG